MDELYGSPTAFTDFLKECITKDSLKITHTSINSPKASYFIPDNRKEEFYSSQILWQPNPQYGSYEKIVGFESFRF